MSCNAIAALSKRFLGFQLELLQNYGFYKLFLYFALEITLVVYLNFLMEKSNPHIPEGVNIYITFTRPTHLLQFLCFRDSCHVSATLKYQTALETTGNSIPAVLWPGAVFARAPDALSVLEAVAAVPRQPHEAARLRAQKNFCTTMQSMIT